MLHSLKREVRVVLADASTLVQYLLFAVTTALIGSVVLDQIEVNPVVASIALFWMAFFFLMILMLETIYRTDFASGVWIRIRLLDEVHVWMLAKVVVFALLASIVAWPLMVSSANFMGAGLFAGWYHVPLVSVLVAVGFFALGTLLLPVANASGRRSVFLPLLLFPLCFPLFLSGGHASLVLVGSIEDSAKFWLMWMIAIDSLFLAISWFLIEDVLHGD